MRDTDLTRSDNLVVSLPMDVPAVPVLMYAPHPCGGYYIEDAVVYGPTGRIGRWHPNG